MTDSIMTVISRKELAEIHKALSLTINERDEARDEVMKWRKELTLCNQERFDAQTQLAEARAEVERLRLPAEAWEAYRALWAAPFADPDKRDAAETRFQVAIAADSAARARAAKESQP